MIICKSHKYRLYPTVKQKIYLDRNFGAVRFVWNQFVANFNTYGTDEYIRNLSETIIKTKFPWLKECISYAIQHKKLDFQEFIKQYFNKNRKIKLGKPKFKKKGLSTDSFTITGQAIKFNKCISGNTLKIPKMFPIKIILDRPIEGELRSVTISKTKSGEYYASILLKTTIQSKIKTGNDIGLDLGITHTAILSDGIKFSNPKYFSKTQAKLKLAQQHLARKLKGSSRYNKQRLKVAKIYQKITRQRNWYYHQISNYLVTNFDSIFVEDLAVKNMIKNRKLSKSIADVSWSTLVGMISYKSIWYGKELCKINKFFSSSKTCSVCDHRLEKLDIDVRDWNCPSCGTNHDRDINAARNILKEGLRNYHGVISAELPEYSCGEDVRPKDFLLKNPEANFDETTNRSQNINSLEIYLIK